MEGKLKGWNHIDDPRLLEGPKTNADLSLAFFIDWKVVVFEYLGGGSGGGSSSCVSKSFSDVLEVDDVMAAGAGFNEGSCDVTMTSEGKTAIEARLFRAGRGGGPRPPLLNHSI